MVVAVNTRSNPLIIFLPNIYSNLLVTYTYHEQIMIQFHQEMLPKYGYRFYIKHHLISAPQIKDAHVEAVFNASVSSPAGFGCKKVTDLFFSRYMWILSMPGNFTL